MINMAYISPKIPFLYLDDHSNKCVSQQASTKLKQAPEATSSSKAVVLFAFLKLTLI